MRPVHLLIFAVVLLVPFEADAQRIRGSVVDATTGLPLPGALLTLRDSARVVKARRLTTPHGTFDLQLAIPLNTVTVEFLGYSPKTLRIESAANQDLKVELQPWPIELASVVAEGESRCRKSEDRNIVTIWSAARAALGASSLSDTRRYRTREFRRTLDHKLCAEGLDSLAFSVTDGRDAYEAASADSLGRFGYIQTTGGKRLFYGPDAELLLSDAFVETHCFSITRKNAPAGMVGLEFWPVPGRKEPDIRGVMWLNEANAELDFVEYTYTATEHGGNDTHGKVDFERLRDGRWVVRNWYIRLPRKAEIRDKAYGRVRLVDVGVAENGGEFLGYHRDSAPRDEIGVVTGTVYDSIAGKPLENAVVYLAGTDHRTTTSGMGSFRFDSVAAGIHYVAFDHPAVTVRPFAERAVRLNVGRGENATARMAIPREETLIKRVCPANSMRTAAMRIGWKNAQGAIVGRVVSNGKPLVGVTVVAELSLSKLPGNRTKSNTIGFSTVTGNTGEYIICGVPDGLDVTLRVERQDKVLASDQITNAPRYLAKDFEVDVE